MINLINVLLQQVQAGDGVLVAVICILALWIGTRLVVWRRTGMRGGRIDALAKLSWQIGSVLGLEQAYEFTRGQIPHETDVALLNAYRLLDLEWYHGFFVESRIERFFLPFHLLMKGIDLFYIIGHVFVTIGVLIWIYTRHRERYPLVRNLLMVTTAIALVAFYLYPTAPPRMLGNYGFVDPLQSNHLVGAGGSQPGSYTYNPYAAMPSLHVAYAIVVSWVAFLANRQIVLRVLAVLYPVVMAATVIISGNHWLLDVAGAVITVLAARLILLGITRGQSALRWFSVGTPA